MTNQKDMQHDRPQPGSGKVDNDPQKATETGKKGGQPSQGGQQQADTSGAADKRGGDKGSQQK